MTDADTTRQEEDYVGEIKGGLRPSMRLVVMGIVHKQPKRQNSPGRSQSRGWNYAFRQQLLPAWEKSKSHEELIGQLLMVVSVSCPSLGEGEEEEEGDVGMQLTVSFPEKAVRRNSRMAGKWGTSETALSFFPFAAGEAFKMEIVCEHQQFRVLVDGQPLCGYTHRVTQLASLTSLHVVGDVQLTKVA